MNPGITFAYPPAAGSKVRPSNLCSFEEKKEKKEKIQIDILRISPAVAPVRAPAAPLIRIRSRGVLVHRLGYHTGAALSIQLLYTSNLSKHMAGWSAPVSPQVTNPNMLNREKSNSIQTRMRMSQRLALTSASQPTLL